MKMCRALLSCLLTGFLLAPLSFAFDLEKVAPAEVGMSSERLARLTTTMTAYVDEGRLPGAVVLVARKGRIVYFEAFGNQDRDSGSKMTTGSIFRIASQTKALISVGIMMLQEEGSLLISDELSKYLPAFVATKVAVTLEGGEYELVPAKRPITLRDLLTHTAGIGYGNGPAAELWREAGIQGWYFANRDEPIQVTVNRMASLPFDSQPGERFVYGYSTDILGAVVEVVSGLPLDVFLRERILEPLAMADSHFYLPESKRGRLTTVYSVGAEGL
ncbi:MAG: serine hydrolase domain-containing protein, partial [Pseudomonadales bacterium]